MSDWPTYLLNLDRDIARLARATAEFERAGLAFTRFPAVNGRALSEAEIAEVYDAEANAKRARHPLTAPEIGIYLSHLAIWREVAKSGAPGAAIFEDDLQIAGNLRCALRVLSQDDGDWDMVKLFSLRPRVQLRGQRQLDGFDLGDPYRIPTTLLGYVIRSDAAAQLVERSVQFFRPVDEDLKFFWEHGLRIAELRPSPITIGNQEAKEGAVSVGKKRAAKERGRGQLAQALHGARFQAGYAMRLHWYRLRGR